MLHGDRPIALTPGPGFIPAPLPFNEGPRLEALQRYRVLDTEDEQAYDDLANLASVICGTPIALISLIDDDRQWFKSRVGIAAHQTPRAQSFCAHAILRPDELFEVDDTLADARFSNNPLVQGEPRIRFYVGAPLVTPEGLAIGTICAIDRKPRTLTDVQRNALNSLARQVVAQFEMRRIIEDLERQSATDALTGAGNRLAFDRTLQAEWGRHVRNHDQLGLLMIDVDAFKSFNDRFGHPAGDRALIEVVSAVRGIVRSSDFVARYGGEEFCVILPETGVDGAMVQAERIRAAIEGASWPLRPITVSIGVCSSVPYKDMDRIVLIAKADRALYMAKRDGRNRVNGFEAWV